VREKKERGLGIREKEEEVVRNEEDGIRKSKLVCPEGGLHVLKGDE
jgi:hypothetical protein